MDPTNRVRLLVSCIMPTHDRRAYVPGAIASFLRQTYEPRELVIVDDGDSVADLVPDDPRIRYTRLASKVRLGLKRNLACEQARGSIIAHWDDDDWYPEWRLAAQMDRLAESAVALTGTGTCFFYDHGHRSAWQYQYKGPGHFLLGSTLAYRKTFWQGHPFADVIVGEDTRFVQALLPSQIADMADPRICVASIHPRNTSRRRPFGPFWRAVPLGDLPPASIEALGVAVPEKRALSWVERADGDTKRKSDAAPAITAAPAETFDMKSWIPDVKPITIKTRRCIVTVGCAAFAPFLDPMLRSLREEGHCPDASVVVFVPEGDTECMRIVERRGAVGVPFRPSIVAPAVRALLYTVARSVEAAEYLCLDPDTVVLDSLAPIFLRLGESAKSAVLACRDAAFTGDLAGAMDLLPGASRADLETIAGGSNLGAHRLVVHDGMFCARRDALLAVAAEIEAMKAAPAWVGTGRGARRRLGMVFNAALAKLGCAVEVDRRYNVQVRKQPVTRRVQRGREEVLFRGCRVAVLHLEAAEWSGGQKPALPQGAPVPPAVAPAPLRSHVAPVSAGPVFSVVLPTWNRSAMLARAVRSVLEQDFDDFELIVVDDASPDPAAAVLGPLMGNRVKVLRNDTNLGVAGARNRGIEASRGELVAFLDDDDEYLSTFLRATHECLRAAPPRVAMSWCGFLLVRPSRVAGEAPIVTERSFDFPRDSEQALVANFLASGTSYGVTVRASALRDVGLFDPALRTGEDTELFYRLIARGYRPAVVPGTHLRRHEHRGERLSSAAMLAERVLAHRRILETSAAYLESHPRFHACIRASLRHLESLLRAPSRSTVSGRPCAP
jgi:glycosyltransferase involved in cell wall biosynthesis